LKAIVIQRPTGSRSGAFVKIKMEPECISGDCYSSGKRIVTKQCNRFVSKTWKKIVI